MIPSLIIRVTGDFDGAIQAAPTAALTASATTTLGVRVINLGKTDVGPCRAPVPSGIAPAEAAVRRRAMDPALGHAPCRPTPASTESWARPCRSDSSPGPVSRRIWRLIAPPAPGDYLLLLDIVTPDRGSLVASGADPTLVRVTVSAATTP